MFGRAYSPYFLSQPKETFLFKVQKHIELSEQTWNAEKKVRHQYTYCSLKRKVSKLRLFFIKCKNIFSLVNKYSTLKTRLGMNTPIAA